MLPRIVCVVCEQGMRPHKIGLPVVEMYLTPPKPYRVWQMDVYRCPECKREVIITGGSGTHVDRGTAQYVLAYIDSGGDPALWFETVGDSKRYNYSLETVRRMFQEVVDATR